ncbi:MAG TPA: YraN family protein [Puia sp.]|jgi:putative endonuclease|nr:YraN family protein [Puia sp.]
MHQHIDLGKKGEELAADWLMAKGFVILRRNWRYGRYEIDIIASRGKVLHIIEVKSRRSSSYGRPEESVSRQKFLNLMQGAAGWLVKYPRHKRLQYDVMAIDLRRGSEPEIAHFEDVYL